MRNKVYWCRSIVIILLTVTVHQFLAEDVPSDVPKGDALTDGGDDEFREEDNVLILTSENFQHEVYSHEYILVEFYTPGCGHCKQLAPEYAKAAKQLKADNLTLAKVKVDASAETALSKEYRVHRYPTMILFHKGEKVEEYRGERDASGIILFMKTRTDPNWKPPNSPVKELNANNFTEFLAKKPVALVLFYTTDCTQCQAIKPEYINAAKKLKEHGIPLAELNGTRNKEIADEFKVKDWPTLLVFRYGRAFEYKGGTTAASMIPYMVEQQKDPTTECKSMQEVQNRIHRYDPTVIGVFKTKSKFYEEYFIVANELRRKPIPFIHTFSDSIAKSFNVTSGEAIIVKKPAVFLSKYENGQDVLKDADITADEIMEFVKRVSRPLVGHRTHRNKMFFYNSRPLVVVYYDTNFDYQYQKHSEITRAKVVEVAKEFSDITFAVSNEDVFQEELKQAKLDDSSADVNVVWYGDLPLKYTMEPVDSFDASVLRTFVRQAQDGQLKPVWKSLPIPTGQDGPVKAVVADNFDVEIYKAGVFRDTILYVYAPWCGHCKDFDKTYKRVAKSLSSERLLFTKMDGMANDVPPGFEIKGYPAIFFIPALKKQEPVLYKGDRSVTDLKKFINKLSSIFSAQEEEQEGKTRVEL